MGNENPETGCCPKFDPAPWDDKIIEWDNKHFIKGRVFTLFYMPVNFGSVIKKLLGKAEKAGAATPDWLCLSDHTSKWNMDIYLAVDREVPGAENIALSGKYISKVYEGNFSETGKWCLDFEKYVKDKGFQINNMYMWYTTCPKCARKYGRNYVAIIANI